MHQIQRHPLALHDLEDIWQFIAEDSIAAADHWLDKIDAQFKLIAKAPGIGRARDELAPGVRSFPIGRYVIFYQATQSGIDVVRVLHSSLDTDAQFG